MIGFYLERLSYFVLQMEYYLFAMTYLYSYKSRFYNNIMKYGNTTAASIPIALKEALDEEKLKKGDILCLAAFGSGFTWASALIKW